MRIREHVDVISQPTVVRLDDLQKADSSWISDSFFITEENEKHFNSLKALLQKENGCGIFLIGHYGSGKSHFLAYLTQQLQSANFASRHPAVVPLSLLNYSAAQSLESLLDEVLSITHKQKDRRQAWNEIAKRYPAGLFLIMDELSEFLRSKTSTESYNEDLRFLQFLGEWAQDHPLWILAALQEQIEHTGDIEYELYRKIKDRYPIRFLLTPAHVKDLIAKRILRKKPTYLEAVEKLAKELMSIYSGRAIDYADFCTIYPLHPVTMELLEEVRDRFSQARGIIDFTLTRLLGNEARGTESFLDRPWGDLITPDFIVDHFSDLFEVQPEFLGIAQRVLPYFRKNIPLFFEKEAQQELAGRLLKLLILVHLSPRRQSLDPEEAALWLMVRISSIDPGRNIEIVKRILDVFCEKGAFLKRQGNEYRLELEDDSGQNLDQLLSKEVEQLKNRGDAIFEELVPLLTETEFNPFSLPRDRWHTRKVRWHFHERDVRVYFGGSIPPEEKGLALQIGLPWGKEPEGSNCYRIHPNRLDLTPDILELAALLQLQERPLPARVLSRIRERIASRKPWFCSLIRTSYTESAVMSPTETKTTPPLSSMERGFAGWLNTHCEWMLRQTYPMFERYAPGYGPLPKEAYREFMKHATEHDLNTEIAPDFVKLIREAYLVPMGLMQRRGAEYVTTARLDHHELVRLITPMIDHHPSPAQVYESLSAPVYGLVPDQIHLLLLTLLIQGEIDIVKGQHSYRQSYETLPTPLQYDKILPGHALNLNQLRDLENLCEGFHIQLPKQWTVLAQKRAIDQLRKYGRRQREQLSAFAAHLKAYGQAENLEEQVGKVLSQWLALEKGDHELQGFQQFLYEIGSPQRFLAEASKIASLPDRFEKLMVENRRFRHLFSFPCVRQCENSNITIRLEALGPAPSLAEPEALQEWLAEATSIYGIYQEWYREQHETWRNLIQDHLIWSYQLPNITRSKHLGLSDLVQDLQSLQKKATMGRCRGLSAMEFQPLCWCGFDGKQSPITELLDDFEKKMKLLETELVLFFQQDKVKTKVREWVNQKLESNVQTLSYLESKVSHPDVENIVLFDQHLSGLELVKSVEPASLLNLLGEGVWEKSALLRTLDQFFSRFGSRIRFHRIEPAAPRKELLSWCCEQALKQGTPLPDFFTPAEYAMIPEIIQADWISEKSLWSLEQMGLGERGICSILTMLLDGTIQLPENAQYCRSVAAALQLLKPQRTASPEQLAELTQLLYEQHERFMTLRPREWLTLLNDLANTKLNVPRVDRALMTHLDGQWIVIDCLGLPFLKVVQDLIQDCFARWNLESLEFGLVSLESSTDAFYRSLLNGNLKKSFQKLNTIDELIHNRNLDFSSMVKLARTELEIGFKKIVADLDTSQKVIILADHGFRLNPEGTAFSHGGPSTLERLIPILTLVTFPLRVSGTQKNK
ncbi:DUF6079 family protein [bacterium]|nr:DUF6079 family protein [bacterium]